MVGDLGSGRFDPTAIIRQLRFSVVRPKDVVALRAPHHHITCRDVEHTSSLTLDHIVTGLQQTEAIDLNRYIILCDSV